MASFATPATDTGATLADRIDAVLPQTQCRRCGYPACRPYAEAIARGEAAINRCPPGGAAGIAELARITGGAVLALDPACGVEAPARVAVIDEAACIGCTKCIQACPVDAIVGTGKLMHTVLADLCTGCELCVPPCPVDCIAMVPTPDAAPIPPSASRTRFLARTARLAESSAGARRERAAIAAPPPRSISHADVLAAIARGRARRKGDVR